MTCVEKRISFLSFSLCVSQACLVNKIVFSVNVEKDRSLSRACLGKTVKKDRFSQTAHVRAKKAVSLDHLLRPFRQPGPARSDRCLVDAGA